MIEILEIRAVNDFDTGQPRSRHADTVITQGGESYLLGVGGLPLAGNVQTILDSREVELWPQAQAGGRAVDLYEVTPKRVLKAVALVIMDEINALRQAVIPALPARTAGQIETAIKNKLKGF